MQINYINYGHIGYGIIIFMLAIANGCVSDPSFFCEELGDKCVKQYGRCTKDDEQSSRIYKDAIIN